MKIRVMTCIAIHAMVYALATAMSAARPADYSNQSGDNMNSAFDFNLLQLDYLDQAMPGTPAAYHEPQLQELTGRYPYEADGTNFDPNDMAYRGFSSTPQSVHDQMINELLQGYKYDARIPTSMPVNEYDDHLSYQVPNEEALSYDPNHTDYTAPIEANYSSLFDGNEYPSSDLFSGEDAQRFELTAKQKAIIDKIKRDAACHGTVKGRRNPWYSSLDNKTKRELVSILQAGWGYAKDVIGYRNARDYTRLHIFKDVGEIILDKSTDPNLLTAIFDATRSPSLLDEEKRKRLLTAELRQKHNFATNTARKYVTEALATPSGAKMTDHELIELFKLRRELSNSGEIKSLRRKISIAAKRGASMH